MRNHGIMDYNFQADYQNYSQSSGEFIVTYNLIVVLVEEIRYDGYIYRQLLETYV